MWLLSSLRIVRLLNCRMKGGTSSRWLLSSRSSPIERYAPTKEARSALPSFRWLWDSCSERRPGRRWRKEKAGTWRMLLCRRVSLRRRRGRLVGTEANWLEDRSKASRDLGGNAKVGEFSFFQQLFFFHKMMVRRKKSSF